MGGPNPGKELTDTKLDRNQGGFLGWRLGRPVKKRQIMGSQSKNEGWKVRLAERSRLGSEHVGGCFGALPDPLVLL